MRKNFPSSNGRRILVTKQLELSASRRRSSVHYFKATILEPLVPTAMVKLRMFSNWGNAEKIAISEIDIVSENGTTLPIRTVNVEPVNTSPCLLKYISDGRLMSKTNEIWSESWPPPLPYRSVDLVITVTLSHAIHSVRIWPTTCSMSPKEIALYVDDLPIYKGILDRDFGSVFNVRYCNTDKSINSLFKVFLDKFGMLPHQVTRVLEIRPLATYVGSTTFTLRKIAVFGIDAEPIDMRSGVLIEAVDISECGELSNLFSFERRNEENWSGTIIGPKPSIRIVFAEMLQISGVYVINSTPVEGVPDLALSKMSIRSNGTTIWTGRIKKDSTLIELAQDDKIREKVRHRSLSLAKCI